MNNIQFFTRIGEWTEFFLDDNKDYHYGFTDGEKIKWTAEAPKENHDEYIYAKFKECSSS